MDNLCAKHSPCPNYDGSIEKWEEEEYNAAIDEQEQALQETRENDEQQQLNDVTNNNSEGPTYTDPKTDQ